MNDNYVKELIQVAAVALAAARVHLYGNSSVEDVPHVSKLLNDVWTECEAQEKKWGTRCELDSPPEHWLTILGEEFGEVADEIIKHGEWSGSAKEGERMYATLASLCGIRARDILERK